MVRATRLCVAVLLLPFMAGCGIRALKKQIADQEQEVLHLRAVNDTLARQLTDARAEEGKARARLARYDPLVEKALMRSAARAGPADRAVPARSAGLEATRDAVARALLGSGATVAVRGDRVAVTAQVSFEPGKAVLTRQGRRLLLQVAKALKAHAAGFDFGVAGHCDASRIAKAATRRAFPTNWHLSGFRALAALDCLVEATGLPPSRFHFRGYGHHRPVASNATPNGRATNRRLEIILEPRN